MMQNKSFNRSIWFDPDRGMVEVIDQRMLPFRQETFILESLEEAAFAIREMVVRGAPLIGVTAAYGMYLGIAQGKSPEECRNMLLATRPTAVNLQWALDRQSAIIRDNPDLDNCALQQKLLDEAHRIAEEDIAMCSRIGDHGLVLLRDLYDRKQDTVHILTHCNAGWLATVQWGTATAPIYKAHKEGLPVHVWVDETRPRNQGARLTAWELKQACVEHHVIADNAGGHLMQQGLVDMVITGSDRTTRRGDVCNKIGTYLKALAARDNDIPFYAALPSSSIDWEMRDGLREIPIEQRAGRELTHMNARIDDEIKSAGIMPSDTPVRNDAFDVTPARLVSGIITERGICEASEKGLGRLFHR
jgi:methylthioribose-1-phosphate isomerase